MFVHNYENKTESGTTVVLEITRTNKNTHRMTTNAVKNYYKTRLQNKIKHELNTKLFTNHNFQDPNIFTILNISKRTAFIKHADTQGLYWSFGS